MSQKKLKKLRKTEELLTVRESSIPVLSIRQILKKNWKFLVIFLLGVVLAYLNGMRGDFVSDDYATIPQNPEIMNFIYGLKGWMGGLINWFLAVTFGLKNTVPYHLTSLLIYLLVLVVSFVLTEILFNNGLISKFSVIIFGFLPIHVEGIAWVAGRPYLLNTLFVMLSLTVFIYYTKTSNKKYLYWFFPLVFLAFAAEKTRSVSLVLVSLLYWISFDNKLKNKLKLGKIILLFGSLFLLVIFLLWPQILERIKSVNSGVNVSDSIFYNPFFQYPTAITKYLQLILFPVDLTLYHTMYVTPMWLNWIVFLVYIAAVVWFWFRDRKYFFALAFIFMAVAPSMAPVKISWLVAERYMFLGSFGAALIFGLLAERYWEKKKFLVIIVFSILLAAYSVRIILRNNDWRTNHNLWVNTCQMSPNSHNAWNNIGDDYDKLGQYENAIKGFGMSYAIKPNYADAYHNQSNIFYKIGRLDLARQGYEQTIVYNPGLYQTYFTLIQLDLMEKRKDDMLRHLALLNQVKPNDLQVAYMAAMAYSQMGMIDEAKAIAETMYKQFPNLPEIKNFYESLMNIQNKNLESGTGKVEQ